MQIKEINWKHSPTSWSDQDGCLILGRVCAQCHAIIRPGDVFCAKCGRKLRQIKMEVSVKQMLEFLNGHLDELTCEDTAKEDPENAMPKSDAHGLTIMQEGDGECR